MVIPNVQQGIYPFKGMKLERADVEWLLASHEHGHGPAQWNNETERGRKGLDMRGADLNQADLRSLPLTRLIGGIAFEELWETTEELRMMASVYMENVNLSEAKLEGANLSGIILGDKKHVGPWLADVQWGSTNLAVVDWSQVNILREEYEAQQKKTSGGERKDTDRRLDEYKTAVRANRQLAVASQGQGLYEDAARFAYRAQHLQRSVLRRQRKVGQYLFSGFLDLIAGYGYKPGRSVLAYLLLVAGFALAFYSFGHLKWYEALVVSLTAFHGRGFFSQQYQPGDPQSIIAAIEAVVGLLIEISFIATFTQRFFGK